MYKIKHLPTGKFLNNRASKRYMLETIQRFPHKIEEMCLSSNGRIWHVKPRVEFICSIFNEAKPKEFEVIEFELKEI